MTSPTFYARQYGYLLLEAMLTVGILAIGILGVSAMQLTAMKSAYSAVQRGEAAFLVASMSDRMRANPLAFANKTTVADIEYNSLPDGSRAKADLAAWEIEIDATFGITAASNSVALGSVNCVTRVNCILQIQWNNPRADAALSPDGKTHASASTYRYKHIVSIIF
jgi:type IV pilus assembly protein PilV